MICGFQRGTSGSAARVNRKKGWKTATASASSKFEPSGRTPDGIEPLQGAIDQSPSELDSVHPGHNPCPTNATARMAYTSAAAAAGRDLSQPSVRTPRSASADEGVPLRRATSDTMLVVPADASEAAPRAGEESLDEGTEI